MISDDLKKDYENRLQNALNSLRDVSDNQLQSNKMEFKNKYETKIKNLQTLLCKQRSKNVSDFEDSHQNQRKIEALKKKVEDLNNVHKTLGKQISEESNAAEDIKKSNIKQVGILIKSL